MLTAAVIQLNTQDDVPANLSRVGTGSARPRRPGRRSSRSPRTSRSWAKRTQKRAVAERHRRAACRADPVGALAMAAQARRRVVGRRHAREERRRDAPVQHVGARRPQRRRRGDVPQGAPLRREPAGRHELRESAATSGRARAGDRAIARRRARPQRLLRRALPRALSRASSARARASSPCRRRSRSPRARTTGTCSSARARSRTRSSCWPRAARQAPARRQTYGKCLIVDPWGEVARAVRGGRGVRGRARSTSPTRTRVRAQLPCLLHRKW